jgi:hypothetical protein
MRHAPSGRAHASSRVNFHTASFILTLMPEYQNNPEGPDNPLIRFLLYIIFSILGAAVGGVFAVLEFGTGGRHSYHYHHMSYHEAIFWFACGAIVGAVGGFVTVWQVCRQIDSDNK